MNHICFCFIIADLVRAKDIFPQIEVSTSFFCKVFLGGGIQNLKKTDNLLRLIKNFFVNKVPEFFFVKVEEVFTCLSI